MPVVRGENTIAGLSKQRPREKSVLLGLGCPADV